MRYSRGPFKVCLREHYTMSRPVILLLFALYSVLCALLCAGVVWVVLQLMAIWRGR